MKPQTQKRIYPRSIAVVLILLVSSGPSRSSSFSDCRFTAQVTSISKPVNLSESKILNIKVVSLNKIESYLCSLVVGQEIEIEIPEKSEVPIDFIQPSVNLLMHYGKYSAMGEDGVAVGGEEWRILGLAER